MTSFQSVKTQKNNDDISNVNKNNKTNKNNKNNNLQTILSNCESYMLTNMNLLKCIQESQGLTDYQDVYRKKIINIDNKPPVIKKRNEFSSDKLVKQYTNQTSKPTKPEYATITDRDTLFWCYYIIKYGYEDYEMVGQRFSVEKNLKIECINKIRKDKELLKTHKLKRSEIESELLNDERLSLKGFLAICIYNNINFLLIDNRKYYELIVNSEVNEDEVSCNIIKCEKGKYTVDITDEVDVIENKLTNYRNSFYRIDNLTKPIKAFSTYSLSELVEICESLKISVTTPDGKKMKKKELYTEILKHF